MRLSLPAIASALAVASLLAACSPSDEGTATLDSTPNSQSTPMSGTQGSSTEESTIPDGLASVDGTTQSCPPDLASDARNDNTPVDDILGIRPGMHIDDVLALLKCRGEVDTIEFGDTFGVSQTYGIDTRQLLRASNGKKCSGQEIVRTMSGGGECGNSGRGLMALKDVDQQFVVALAGMPGEEEAGVIWRKTSFSDEERPTQDAIRRSLEQKYGEPHSVEADRRGREMLVWVYDLMGRPMSPQAPNHNWCMNSTIQPTFESNQAWVASCGLTIKAQLTPASDNEYLLEQMEVVVADQKEFYEEGEVMKEALAEANSMRQRQEAEDAQSRNTGLDL